MLAKNRYSSVTASIVVHALLLGSLAMFSRSLGHDQPDVIVETIFDEERQQEEFTKDLEADDVVAETQNFIAGGIVSTAIGGSGAPAVQQQKIETSESLQEPRIQINASEITMLGDELLGQDLGEADVSGEIGAVVEGYGAALSRITQELIRMMRQQKVLVVWLFDESESMKDDQKEVAAKFHTVYEELGIQTQTDKRLKKSQEVLSTMILSFGEKINKLTPAPTSNIRQIQSAIDQIAVDTSGYENMCNSISFVVDEFGKVANRQKRRLIIIVVSDESPSDHDKVEEAITKTQRITAPVYILGREAVFGYPFARVRWKDPDFGLWHWVRINRGPETAFPECLQYNGLGRRWDSFSSGFGPYSQVRICKETGGIYFLLPGEEQNLIGAGAQQKRKFEALAMKEYRPLLLPRRDYEAARNVSKFRSTQWDIISKLLNPYEDRELSVRWAHWPIDSDEFRKIGQAQFTRATLAFGKLNQAAQSLENVRSLRGKERFQRWRANYDLMVAQCMNYRVRLFQYMLTLDEHAVTSPKLKKPKEQRVEHQASQENASTFGGTVHSREKGVWHQDETR